MPRKNEDKTLIEIRESIKETPQTQEDEDFLNLKKSLANIKREVERFELKRYPKESERVEFELTISRIKKKLKIEKTKRSRSFRAWLFNNNEL